MTVREIKETYTMQDIVERYGFRPNRAGFIKCPFHTDDTASLKIYKDSFYCFGCGKNGDVISFTMLMENVSFKDAFRILGGTYDHPESRADRIAREKKILIFNQERERKKRQIESKKRRMRTLVNEMNSHRVVLNGWKPFSPEWCDCMKGYLAASFEYELLDEEVNRGGDGH